MAVLAIVLVGDVAAVATHQAPSSASAGRAAPPPASEAGPSTTVAPTAQAMPGVKPTPAVKPKPGRSTTTTLNEVLGQFPLMSEGLAYELTLTPTCGHPGDSFTAVLRFKQNFTSGAAMPFYADGSYEKGNATVADKEGKMTYTWIAKPVIGEGRLVTQAHDGHTEENGTKIIPFRIVKPGASC